MSSKKGGSRWDVKAVTDEEKLRDIGRRLALEQGQGVEEIIINQCEPVTRYALTKRQTQEQIYQSTGATVVTKGAYVPEHEIDAFSSPLFLHITGPCRAVDEACRMIKQIIDSGGKLDCLTPGLIRKVIVHLPGGIVDPKFNFIGKLLGPNGQFVKHITTKTRARVQVGATEALSDPTFPEKFHLQVTAPTREGLEEAIGLTNDLVTHVVSDYENYLREKRQKLMNPGMLDKKEPVYASYPHPYNYGYPYGSYGGYQGYDPLNPNATPTQPAPNPYDPYAYYGYQGGYPGGYQGGYPGGYQGYPPQGTNAPTTNVSENTETVKNGENEDKDDKTKDDKSKDDKSKEDKINDKVVETDDNEKDTSGISQDSTKSKKRSYEETSQTDNPPEPPTKKARKE
jgi:hypothetical protein